MNTPETLTGSNGTLRRLLAPHEHMGSLMPAWVRAQLEGVELLLVDVSSTTEVWVPHDGVMVHAQDLSGWPRKPHDVGANTAGNGEPEDDAQVLYVRTPQIEGSIGLIVGRERIATALADLGELRTTTDDAEARRRATVAERMRGKLAPEERVAAAAMVGSMLGHMMGVPTSTRRAAAERNDDDDDGDGTPCVALQHPLDYGGIRAFYGFAFSECSTQAEVDTMARALASSLSDAEREHRRQIESSTTDAAAVIPPKAAPHGEALEPNETSGSRAATPA